MEDMSAQNPSYQNFLAKQMLANPTAHGITPTSSAPISDEPPKEEVNSQKLGQILDVIDSKRKEPSEDTDPGLTMPATSSATPAPVSAAVVPSSPFDWIRNFDASTGHFYYYNYKTGVSQWEMPEGFVETATPAPAVPLHTDIASYAATFNQKTGHFSATGTQSYWEQMGRPADREGRQMSAFFNLSDLEKNRAEAKLKKEQLQQMKGVDWRKYKEDRKKKRQKISQRWLYEDD